MFYRGKRRPSSSPAREGVRCGRPLLFILLAVVMALAGATIFATVKREGAMSRLARQFAKSRQDWAVTLQKSSTLSPKGDILAGSSFRISQVSALGAERDASSPDIAYNPDDNEYLAVWVGNGLSAAELRGVDEIFGHRVNAATGATVGADFRISNMSDGGKDRAAYGPKVVYNHTSHEYLVVWHGQGSTASPDSIFEIYGQRLSRTGAEMEKDFRISTTTDLGKIMGSFVRASAHADVAWNSASNQYLVVWDAMGQPDDIIRTEIFGQLLGGTGGAVGKNFRISNTNDQGAQFNASLPQVAYNSKNNQYLIVWTGPSKNKNQNEVWGQGLSAQGALVAKGNGDFLISQVTTNVGSDRDASAPQVAYNSSSNEYLVVFQATGVPGPDNDKLSEIFGQRINAQTLLETGPNDFRISNTMAGGSNGMNGADNPRVAFNELSLEYLVVWRGVRTDVPFEIFGQRVSLEGKEIETDFQISNAAAIARDRTVNTAALASSSAAGEYLAVWEGDALPGQTGKGVNEIFGQRIKSSARRP